MPRETDSDEATVDPRVVAFGGGTGMSCLLSGLKSFTPEITAIVTVTDNGGSSGRLRKEYDMVPPGDIRNCLVALSEGDPILAELLQYRFEESDLAGHSFGNLFITALTKVTGSFDEAVRRLNSLLQVRGRVLPATGRKVSLIARHPDGSKSTGEVAVSASGKPIVAIEMRPRVGPAAPDVLAAIAEADLMVFGPGSLFTSLIPNLLVPGIGQAVLDNPCHKVYVANIMTQPGETTGMDLAQHVAALEAPLESEFISGVLFNDAPLPADLAERYGSQGAAPVNGLGTLAVGRDLVAVAANLLDDRAGVMTSGVLRHRPDLLARALVEGFLPDRSELAPRDGRSSNWRDRWS